MCNFKAILDKKRCPKCGKLIPWWRILFINYTWVADPWRCSNCSTRIGYNQRHITMFALVLFVVFVGFVALSELIDILPFEYIFFTVGGCTIILCGWLYLYVFSEIKLKE